MVAKRPDTDTSSILPARVKVVNGYVSVAAGGLCSLIVTSLEDGRYLSRMRIDLETIPLLVDTLTAKAEEVRNVAKQPDTA